MLDFLKDYTRPTQVVLYYDGSKQFTVVAKINFNYQAELNAEQAADNQELTEAGKRNWGVRVPNSPLVEHKGNHYLSIWITEVVNGEVKTGYRDLKLENIKMISIGGLLFNA